MVGVGREKKLNICFGWFPPSPNPSEILIISIPYDKVLFLKTDKNILEVWKGDFRQPGATMSLLIV